MGNLNNGQIEDRNVAGYDPLITPYLLWTQIPLTDKGRGTVSSTRRAIRYILEGEDRRILLIAGPCSIHNPEAAIDYARRLNDLRERVSDKFEILMRAYFEKPRTLAYNWRGLLYDPHLNGQGKINDGLFISRQLLMNIIELGLPIATEFVDTDTPQHYSDTISWNAVGARTVEAQVYRQMASGLSMPVGFKNNTSGNVQVAVNAALSARYPNWFPGLDPYGIKSIVRTKGNRHTHIVLRGGKNGTNYDSGNIEEAQRMLIKVGLEDRLIVDCSHGNSEKDHRRQPIVFEDVVGQIFDGNSGIMGLMLESNIIEGSQKIPEDFGDLRYGLSITDACIGWETTEELILDAYKMLSRK